MDMIHVIIGTALAVLGGVTHVLASNCDYLGLSIGYSGMFCTGEGIVTHRLLPHQCRSFCLMSETCRAYNFNLTARTCTSFKSPCPQAFGDVSMEFAVFRKPPIAQCYEWVPYSSGDGIDQRMIFTDDPLRLICRLKRDGNDIVCYFHTLLSLCYGNWQGAQFSQSNQYPCQRLRIKYSCTIFWVPFTAYQAVPSGAIIAGHMANGDTVYVTKFDYYAPISVNLAGHYVTGADSTLSVYDMREASSQSMMMAVIL